MNILSRFTLALVLCSLMFSCTKSKSVKKENIMHIGLTGEISTLDPANAYDTISNTIIYQAYEQLFEYHYLKRPYTLQPLLAESMPQVSDDGKTYIIQIKKGIQYHDNPVFKGKPRFVKAHDFITQIKRLAFLPTKSNGEWLFNGKIVGFNEFRKNAGSDFTKFEKLNISGLSAPDDHTLKIQLTKPYPQMLYALAMAFTSPMPIEAVREYKNLLNEQIIGTGPYMLKNYYPLKGVTLVKNPNFHHQLYPSKGDRRAHKRGLLKDAGAKLPFIDEIVFNIMKEDQTRWLNFRKKNIDMLVIPKDNYPNAINPDGTLTKELSDEGINLEVGPTLTYWWLAFNMNDSLLGKNKKLREAIAHAVDMDKFIAVFTNNVGQKANSIYPPGIPGYSPSHKLPYEYNIEKAKSLLVEAGFPNGKGIPRLNFDTRGTSTNHRQRAEYIKSELKKIGIEIDIIVNTFPAFLEKSKQGKLQFWQGGWAMDYPDAENSLQLLITKNHPPGPNTSNYSNKQIDQYFEKLKILSDGPQKREIMEKMEKIINEDLPWVMQYYSRNYILYQNYLKNYRHSDLVYNYYKYLKIESSTK